MPFFCIGVEIIVKIHEVQPQATSKLLDRLSNQGFGSGITFETCHDILERGGG